MVQGFRKFRFRPMISELYGFRGPEVHCLDFENKV